MEVRGSAPQSSIAFSIGLFPFGVHSPTTVDKIAEHVHEGFFDDNFCAHDRLRVLTKLRKGVLRLFQFARSFCLFL